MAVAALTVTASRARAAHFLQPFHEEPASFVIKVPEEQTLTLYLSPFSVSCVSDSSTQQSRRVSKFLSRCSFCVFTVFKVI